MPLYLSIKNPLDASKPFPPDLLAALEKKVKRERIVPSPYQEKWTAEYPLREWVKDIKSGNEYWTTQVPKKALPLIREFGYDGIKEKGMKGAPESERQVNWIALEPTQIKSALNVGTFDPVNPLMRFQPDDSTYLAAVEKGDTATAQQMVDQAAKAAGYDPTALMFQGRSKKGLTVLQNPRGEVWVTSSKETASIFADVLEEFFPYRNETVRTMRGKVYDVYPATTNPKRISIKETLWERGAERAAISLAKKEGHDSLIIEHGEKIDMVLFSPNQIKSADPVTYNDAGKVIPLSERFDVGRDDIRFMPAEELTNGTAWRNAAGYNVLQKGKRGKFRAYAPTGKLIGIYDRLETAQKAAIRLQEKEPTLINQ
jgi:hypothetical protein